jgi:hypothetical protein
MPPAAESTQVIQPDQLPGSPGQAPGSGAPPEAAPGWGAPPADQMGTTVMPAWQPGASAPPTTGAPPVGETMPLPHPGEPSGAELAIESGPDAGQTFKVTSGPARVGRSPDNDLILRDPATSGHHARLERRGAQFFVVDLGSTNGTLVNGEPVQEKELKHNDKITIGQNAVKFSLV